MTALQNISAPLGRVLLSLIFIVSGVGKISAYAGTQAYMESAGLPGFLLPAVIALEVLGGLAILAGFMTRPVAFLLAGFSLLSALLFHANFGDPMQQILFLKNVALAGAFLVLISLGPGPWSIDNRVRA